MTTSRVLSLLLPALLLAACADDANPNLPAPAVIAADAAAPDAAAPDAAMASDAAGDLGAEPDGPPAPGLAIVSSDRTSSAISLVQPGKHAVARDRCLDSGSKPPMLSAVISGDVALPSQPQPGHELLAIDRKKGTLTWLDPQGCTVLRQASTGTWSNPQDAITVGGKTYVPRYGVNPGDMTEGNDVLVLDTRTGSTLGRIDLRPLATASPDPAKTILPMPTRAVHLGGRLYVALNELGPDFDVAGAGRVAVIDPATDKVVGSIDPPGLKNCGGLTVAPGAAPGLVVACGGPFSDGDKQIDSAGVAWVDLAVTPPAIKVVGARAFGRPVSGFAVQVQSRTLAFTVVTGEFMGAAKDAVWSFSFEGTAAPQKVFEASESFVLAAQLDPREGLLYVLDAAKADPRVRVFSVAEGQAPAPVGAFLATAIGLPPREMAWY